MGTLTVAGDKEKIMNELVELEVKYLECKKARDQALRAYQIALDAVAEARYEYIGMGGDPNA